jgi:uncharacterized protein YndB with AHSA1/START domain
MFTKDDTGTSTARPEEVFAVLADPARWPEWNAGVTALEMHGPFAAGTTAVMVLPDGEALPFTFTWVEQDKGFEDLTEVPDAGVTVRVRHELAATAEGTLITYRCEVDGPDDVAAEVGYAVSADFPDVIAALAARAERAGG